MRGLQQQPALWVTNTQAKVTSRLRAGCRGALHKGGEKGGLRGLPGSDTREGRLGYHESTEANLRNRNRGRSRWEGEPALGHTEFEVPGSIQVKSVKSHSRSGSPTFSGVRTDGITLQDALVQCQLSEWLSKDLTGT